MSLQRNAQRMKRAARKPDASYITGRIGSNQTRVYVDGVEQPNQIWVNDGTSEKVVFNPGYSYNPDADVIIEYDEKRGTEYISGFDIAAASNKLGAALPAYAIPDAPAELIQSPVVSDRLKILRGVAQSGFLVEISGGRYDYNGDEYYYVGGQIDLTTTQGAITSGNAALVVIGFNPVTQVLTANAGTEINASFQGTLTRADALAVSLTSGSFPIRAYNLNSGDTDLQSVNPDFVFDLRGFLQFSDLATTFTLQDGYDNGDGVIEIATTKPLVLESATGDDTKDVLSVLNNADSEVAHVDSNGKFYTVSDYVAFEGSAKKIDVAAETLQNTSTGIYQMDSPGLAVNGVDNTQLDISAGKGHILNYHDDPDNPTYTEVAWNAQSLTTFTANVASYILINSAGTASKQTTYPTQQERRENIFVGRAVDIGGVLVQAAPAPDVITSPANQIHEILDTLGIINKSVAVINNGANLKIDIVAGDVLVRGAGFIDNNAAPNEVSISSASPKTFAYVTQTAGSTGANTTDVVPGSYDNAGTITAISGSNNRATNQRVYLFPPDPQNIRVQYGQVIYNSLTDAIQGLGSETFTINPNIPGNGVLIAVISVTKGCTDLSDTTAARILPASRFGDVAVGGSGQSVSTLQQAYNNGDGLILTDATNGAVTFQRGSASDNDNVFVIQNGSGSDAATIDGNGIATLFRILSGNSNFRIENTAASGSAIIQFDPQVDDGSSTLIVRYGRSSNSSGGINLQVYAGDGTAGAHHDIVGGGGDTRLGVNGGGLIAIGGNSVGGEKFQVVGNDSYFGGYIALATGGSAASSIASFYANGSGEIFAVDSGGSGTQLTAHLDQRQLLEFTGASLAGQILDARTSRHFIRETSIETGTESIIDVVGMAMKMADPLYFQTEFMWTRELAFYEKRMPFVPDVSVFDAKLSTETSDDFIILDTSIDSILEAA